MNTIVADALTYGAVMLGTGTVGWLIRHLLPHLDAARGKAVAAIVQRAAQAAVASLVDAAGTTDLSAFTTRDRALSAAMDFARRFGGGMVKRLGDDDLRDLVRSALFATDAAVLLPGQQALPDEVPPASPGQAAPMDETDLDELVRSLVEKHVVALAAALQPSASANS
jgi:hypothetical protein